METLMEKPNWKWLNILWMEQILHRQKDGWNPINNEMFTTYQLVQDFATIHIMLTQQITPQSKLIRRYLVDPWGFVESEMRTP